MSETIPELKIDKSKWGAGPWDTEPDRMQWQHAGYACLIVRNHVLGNLCGYVGVPESHPEFQKEPEDIDATVHGGVTYTGLCSGRICHIPEPGMPERVWWIGFDCAHAGDIAPGTARDLWEDSFYRGVEFVTDQCEWLADQLRALADEAK